MRYTVEEQRSLSLNAPFPQFTFRRPRNTASITSSFSLPIRNGKDKSYSYEACNLRVADCGYYEARRDGNTCRIVECLNKIIAIRCASQILSLPLSSGQTKYRKICCLKPSSHYSSAVLFLVSYATRLTHIYYKLLIVPKPAPASQRYKFGKLFCRSCLYT